MQLPVVVVVLTAFAEAHSHIDTIRLLGRNFHEHILLWLQNQMLGVVDNIQQDILFKYKSFSIASINESVLDKCINQIELIRAHDSFLILNNWRCCELETEGHVFETSIRSEPVSHIVLLLIKNN